MNNLIALIIAYLIGSLSSAILLSKFLKLPDPRTTGSGNPGASNILKTVGKNQALAVLVGDGLKGFVALLLARILGAHGFMLGLTALAAVGGHVFPIFHKFKGGKGVATMMGTLLMMNFGVGLLSIAVWVVVAFLLKYASLASLVAAVGAPILMLIFGSGVYFLPALLITALIVWRHWENIERLRKGTETKINFSKAHPVSAASQSTTTESLNPEPKEQPKEQPTAENKDSANKD